MEDFHTVCRSKLWQTAKLSCGMVYTTQGAGPQDGGFKSAFILCAFPNTACYLLENVVWPSRETCTSNPSWLRKFNQIEGHDNSWKGRQFEILMVTHKHPVRFKVHQTSSISLPLSSRLTSQNFPSLSISLNTSM